jgi:SAM-dependent methyltransferase
LRSGHSHTERFSGRVEAYLAYRPRFPHGIIAFLREHGALPEDAVVADVGAGTGMLAEIFLEAGHRVIAIEPNREMLSACRELEAQQPALEDEGFTKDTKKKHAIHLAPSALNHIQRKSCQRSLLIARLHIQSRLVHSSDDLIERDFVLVLFG